MKNKPRQNSFWFAHLVRLFAGLALVWAGWQPAHADPGVLYAAPSATGAGDCGTWDDACALQTALANAVSGDQVWVKMGVYLPGAARTDTFSLVNGVEVYGGFTGSETQLDQRDWAANPTVLSGDIAGDNCFHIVTSSSGVTASARLDGFTISGGRADSGSYPDNMGGGIFNDNGSPTLVNLTITDNSAANSGGGMYNRNEGSPALTNVTFSLNSASYGGGMFNRDTSNPLLTSILFEDNMAEYGGGMYNANTSSPTLTNVTFYDNLASSDGGGIYNATSSPILVNVFFQVNHANANGGGMYNSMSSPSLTNVIFSGNTASGGGGMYNYWASSPVLTNVTFSGNTATAGGGMVNDDSDPVITNATFGGNTGVTVGGGMYNSRSNPVLKNTILWGNISNWGRQINNYESTPTIAYSDVEGSGGSGVGWTSTLGTDLGGNIDADPLFSGIATGDLHLRITSPAIDAGDNAAVPAGTTTDPDGHPRFFDNRLVADTGSGSPPIVDIGADEYWETRIYLPMITRSSG